MTATQKHWKTLGELLETYAHVNEQGNLVYSTRVQENSHHYWQVVRGYFDVMVKEVGDQEEREAFLKKHFFQESYKRGKIDSLAVKISPAGIATMEMLGFIFPRQAESHKEFALSKYPFMKFLRSEKLDGKNLELWLDDRKEKLFNQFEAKGVPYAREMSEILIVQIYDALLRPESTDYAKISAAAKEAANQKRREQGSPLGMLFCYYHEQVVSKK